MQFIQHFVKLGGGMNHDSYTFNRGEYYLQKSGYFFDLIIDSVTGLKLSIGVLISRKWEYKLYKDTRKKIVTKVV